jgi:hypothetical protein
VKPRRFMGKPFGVWHQRAARCSIPRFPYKGQTGNDHQDEGSQDEGPLPKRGVFARGCRWRRWRRGWHCVSDQTFLNMKRRQTVHDLLSEQRQALSPELHLACYCPLRTLFKQYERLECSNRPLLHQQSLSFTVVAVEGPFLDVIEQGSAGVLQLAKEREAQVWAGGVLRCSNLIHDTGSCGSFSPELGDCVGNSLACSLEGNIQDQLQ